ncbi:DUF5954 family protein [Streptomyces sp. NPDC055721]|uniref:DUF5954 family protein n=1 Tax=Streptomyces sp. NPDC127132 TaxID=3345374 RepID=UPI0036250C11
MRGEQRPTDPEPVLRVWERPRGARRSPDTDVLLDPEKVNGPMVEALRIGLREFQYTGKRYPADVRADSRRAVVTHPDIAMRQVGEQCRAAGRADDVRVDGREFRICRVERMVRFGPDGPEGPRPSDVDEYGPAKMHPRMDEDGTLHYDESDRGDEDDNVHGVDPSEE